MTTGQEHKPKKEDDTCRAMPRDEWSAEKCGKCGSSNIEHCYYLPQWTYVEYCKDCGELLSYG